MIRGLQVAVKGVENGEDQPTGQDGQQVDMGVGDLTFRRAPKLMPFSGVAQRLFAVVAARVGRSCLASLPRVFQVGSVHVRALLVRSIVRAGTATCRAIAQLNTVNKTRCLHSTAEPRRALGRCVVPFTGYLQRMRAVLLSEVQNLCIYVTAEAADVKIGKSQLRLPAALAEASHMARQAVSSNRRIFGCDFAASSRGLR